MYLWSKKYCPHKLKDFEYNQEWTVRLKGLNPIENTIIYGIRSSGKKSRIMALLSEIYGDTIFDKNVRTIEQSTKKKITITTIESMYHTEIDFKPYGIYDRTIISNFIKPKCRSRNIMTDKPQIIIIHNAEYISHLGQKMLLGILEKSSRTARFIFITHSLSKIIMPLKSRCFTLRCRGPKKEEILNILQRIGKDNDIKLTKKRGLEIIERSSINGIPHLQNSIHILQMSYLVPNKKSKKYKAYKLKHIEFMKKLLKAIEKKNIMDIRKNIFSLTTKNIDPANIITYVMLHLVKKQKDNCKKFKILTSANRYCHLMEIGNKIPFYIEGFIANAVNIDEEGPRSNI